MSNPLTAVEHGLEDAGKAIVHGVEDVLSIGSKVIHVIEDVKLLTPEFKSELQTLINDAQPLGVALAPVIAAGGKNPVADLAAVEPVVQQVIKLAADFIQFFPTIEAAFEKLGLDTQ